MQISNTLDEKIMGWSKSAQESIVKFDSLCKQIPEHVETSFLQAANESKQEWVELFNNKAVEFLDFTLKLDVERTERIAKETDKVVAKIIEALKKNTTSTIDVITEMVDDKPIVYYPIDKETRDAIDELTSNPKP